MRRPPRGATLIELVIAVILSSLLLAVLTPWVMSLLATSHGQLASAGADRAAHALTSALNTDLTHVVVCPATGSVVAASDAGLLAVYTHADPYGQVAQDGTVYLSAWRLSADQVTRATVPATVTADGCGAVDAGADPIADPWSVYATSFAGSVSIPPGAGQVLFAGPVAGHVVAELAISTGDVTRYVNRAWTLVPPQVTFS